MSHLGIKSLNIVPYRGSGTSGMWIGLTIHNGSTTDGTYSDGTNFDCGENYHDFQNCPLETAPMEGPSCVAYGSFEYFHNSRRTSLDEFKKLKSIDLAMDSTQITCLAGTRSNHYFNKFS